MLYVKVVRLPFFKGSRQNLYCWLRTVYSFTKRRNKPGFSGLIKFPIVYPIKSVQNSSHVYQVYFLLWKKATGLKSLESSSVGTNY